MSFELTPQKLVYGGDALGYHQGRVVLVGRALPGERLEAEGVRAAKGVVHARPVRILEAASERVEPRCPYFGRCGGCQYQHLGSERQTAAKREILRETLRRLGKIAWDVEIATHAAHPWNYRNQAGLKIARREDGGASLGFFEAESHRLFPVDTCLIISPRLNAILAELRGGEWSERLSEFSEIELLADDRDEEVSLTLRGGSHAWALDNRKREELAQDCLARLPGVKSAAIECGREFRVFGSPALLYQVGDFRYQISPGSFFQASRFLLSELVAAVTGPVAGEGSALPPAAAATLDRSPGSAANPSAGSGPSVALDLFAGVGLFTLPLARRFAQVVGVEANARSAADLAANAQAHGFSNVRSVPQAAFDFLRRYARVEPDLVILDPPRAGVGSSTLTLLAGLRAKRIHYVSCHPPTLARDLAFLLERGYRLDSVELFDFFPQTYHIECLTRLSSQEKI